MLTVSAIAALAAILAPCAQGHGWMSSPMSRALCDGRTAEGIFMPGGGNGAGPGMHDLGGVPGVCGDPFQSMTDIRTNFANEPCSIQQTLNEGDEFTVTVELSNQHGGYFEFAVCPEAMGPTEECFAQNILMTESGAQQYWAQPTPMSSSISVDNREVYNVKVQLPPGLTCEHCTLMWTWWTSHQCTYDCDEQICGAYANFNNPMPTGGSGPPCASDKPAKGELPQMFRACGDIAILPAGAGASPALQEPVPETPEEPEVEDLPTPPMESSPPPTSFPTLPTPTPTPEPETPEEPEVEDPPTPLMEPSTPPTPYPSPAPTPSPAKSACGGDQQPVCTDYGNDREYECDWGFIGKDGICVPYGAHENSNAYKKGACGADQQPVCTGFGNDREYECDWGLIGKDGICVPYGTHETSSPTTLPPSDPQIKNIVEEEDEAEEELEDMPALEEPEDMPADEEPEDMPADEEPDDMPADEEPEYKPADEEPEDMSADEEPEDDSKEGKDVSKGRKLFSV